MLNSVALQVVIGLIFIYLLYSLLATVLSEMIASLLGLRARTLKAALLRMLNDEEVVNGFYNNPEIKFLGGSGLYGKPSTIQAAGFSKALVGELSGNGTVTPEKISAVLKVSAQKEGCNGSSVLPGAIETETAGYMLGLWEQAEGDVAAFRKLLEEWFNRTMQQASEWYRRKIQVVLVVLGFLIAWFFCADTFTIVKKLSVDQHAREQMVILADAYVKANPVAGDTLMTEAKRKLSADLAGAHSVLGLGSWLPDRVSVVMDPATREKIYTPEIDHRCLSTTDLKISNGKIAFTFWDKLAYLFRLPWYHFFGFLITAIAISLGAPFWFDLLNKFMKLRTSAKEKP